MNQNWFISHHHQQTSQHPNSVPGSLLLFSYPALAASPPLFGQQPPTTPRPLVWSVVVVSCSVISRFLASHTISTQTCITRFDYGGIRLGLRLARLETILRILDPGHTHDDQQTDSHTAQVSQSRRGFRNSTVCCMLNKRQKTCSIGNLAHGYSNIGFKSSFCIKSSKCVREA